MPYITTLQWFSMVWTLIYHDLCRHMVKICGLTSHSRPGDDVNRGKKGSKPRKTTLSLFFTTVFTVEVKASKPDLCDMLVSAQWSWTLIYHSASPNQKERNCWVVVRRIAYCISHSWIMTEFYVLLVYSGIYNIYYMMAHSICIHVCMVVSGWRRKVLKWQMQRYGREMKEVKGSMEGEAYVPILLWFFKLPGIHWN